MFTIAVTNSQFYPQHYCGPEFQWQKTCNYAELTENIRHCVYLLTTPYNPLHGGIHKHSPTKEFTKILLHDSFIKVNNFECNLCGIQLKRLRIGYGLTVCWYSSAIICHNVIFPSCYPNILSLSLSIYSPAS